MNEFKKLCHYFSHDKKLKDLQLIRIGLAHGQQYIDAFIETEGILYALTGCITGAVWGLETQRESANFGSLFYTKHVGCCEIPENSIF